MVFQSSNAKVHKMIVERVTKYCFPNVAVLAVVFLFTDFTSNFYPLSEFVNKI